MMSRASGAACAGATWYVRWFTPPPSPPLLPLPATTRQNGDSVTTVCARSGTVATFSHLVEAGADAFHVNNVREAPRAMAGWVPSHVCWWGMTALQDGMSPVMLACWSGLFGIVETIRKRYARYGRVPEGHLDLQAKGVRAVSGLPSMQYSSLTGGACTLRILGRLQSRNTALHFALENERWECARWLIKMGANPNVANVVRGPRSRWVAARTRRLWLLTGAACAVRLHPQDGDTPLLMAARATHFELVRRLVAAGADVNAVNKVCTAARGRLL